MTKIEYLSDEAKRKKWIRDITSYKHKRVAVIGGNGSAKSTYSFRHFARLCWRRPGLFLITSGTADQAMKLYDQKLKTIISKMGLSRENNVKMIYELSNGSQIHIKSKENYKTAEGPEYDYWFADEFQDHSQEAAEMFLKRTRRSRENSMVRVTGLPDDPESWQYKFLEDNHFVLHEISLYDHPDPDWIHYYEGVLKELFTGAKLKRYLKGERVSLTGIGLFSADETNKMDVEYDPDKDLYLCWDFNVEYRAVTAWQQVGLSDESLPEYNCIESFQLKNTTTQVDAEEMCDYYRGHNADVILHGDASGENRTAATSDSMWRQIRGVFEHHFSGRVRYKVPDSNPNVKDTIQILNWALMKGLITFSDAANIAYRYLVAAKSDKYGEVDKSGDYREGGAKTHEVDTIRYLAWLIYDHHFPGTKRRVPDRKTLKSIYGDAEEPIW